MKLWKALGLAALTICLGGGAARADNSPGLPEHCRQGDLKCISYDPSCVECHVRSGRPACDEVQNGETGYRGCTVLFNGATAVSCVTNGSFCSRITVNP